MKKNTYKHVLYGVVIAKNVQWLKLVKYIMVHSYNIVLGN